MDAETRGETKKVPAKWHKRVEKARRAMERAKALREAGLKGPVLTAPGGPQAADFKAVRRFRR